MHRTDGGAEGVAWEAMKASWINGWIPEGGLGFKGGDEEEDGVGDEQESRDKNLCAGVDEGLEYSAC